MKIVSIKFLNLNSLKGEHEIRFDRPPFTDSGLFAITGPTGAGKTTILDAITIALYGNVHRHDKDDPSEIMTRHTGESYSEVEFEVKDMRYRAKWSNRRAHKKPEGKLQGVTMELAYAATGEIIVGKPLPEVQKEIIGRCGLDYNQFIRSVMLSQGDFTRFLKANENDRSDLLEKITDTSIYSEISTWIYKEAKNQNTELTELRARLQNVALLSEEELITFQSNLSAITEQAKVNKKERDVAMAKQQWLARIALLNTRQQQLQDHLQAFTIRYETNRPLFNRLALHQQAMKHQPMFSHLEDGRKQLTGTNKKLADISSTLPALQQSLEALYVRIEEANEQAETARTELQNSLPVIAEVERKDVLIESTAEQTKTDQQLFDEAQSALEQTEREAQENEEVLRRSDQEIKNLTLWLSAHAHEGNLQNDIPVFGNYLEKLQELFQTTQVSEREKLQLNNQAKQLETMLAQLQHDAAGHTRNLESTRLQLQQNNEQLQGILAGKRLEEWEAEAEVFPDLIHTCEQQYRLATGLRQLEEKRIQSAAEEKEYTEQHTKESEIIIGLRKDLADSEELLASLRKNVELQLLIRKYENDRQALQPGKACPLCGSVHHPYIDNKYANELTEVEKKRDAQQLKAASLSKAVTSKEFLIRGIQSDLEYTLKQQEQTGLDLASAQTEFSRNNTLLPAALELDKPKIIQLVITKKKEEFDTLRKIIQQIRTVEKQLKNQEVTISIISEKEVRTLGEIRDNNTKLEHTHSSISRIQRELDVTDQTRDDITAKADVLLDQYQLSFQYAAGNNMLQQLKARSAAFIDTQGRLQQQQILYGKAQSDVTHGKESIAEKNMYAQRLGTLLATGRKRLQDLRDERFDLFGEKETVFEKRRLEKELTAKKDIQDQLTQALSGSIQALRIAESQQTEWTRIYKEQQHAVEERSTLLTAQLLADDIASIEVLQQQFLPKEEAVQIEALYRESEKEKANLLRSLHDVESELLFETEKKLTELSIEVLSAQITSLDDTVSALDRDFGRISEMLKADEKQRIQHEALAERIGEQRKECERWNKLSFLIGSENGKRFSRFAQGLTLARLTELANRHLLRLSDRYRIIKSADKDLELMIIDGYQADVVRPMTTLSGGESFLVSLALALGLSDLASRKVQINSLFIDEGFGTLDAETLDVAISALENLQANGKTIGIISHVEALKERIGIQIQLSKQPGGSSRIRIMRYNTETTGS